jgi:hypothetical protein
MSSLVNINVKVPNWLDLICVSPLLLFRLLRFGYPFRRIPLTQGYFAVVDPVVYYVLVKFKWRLCKNKRKKTLYAERSIRKSTGRYSRLLMHCQLMPDVPPGLLIDHANGDGLDNRLSNLRPATVAQNAWNARPRKSRAGYKGVAWAKDKNLWRGNICVNGKRIHLGYFRTSVAAARAYDAAARKYFGEFARLNFS